MKRKKNGRWSTGGMIVLAAFGIYIAWVTAENVAFGAVFFGEPVPPGFGWVMNLSYTELNLADTLGLIVFILVIYYAVKGVRGQRKSQPS